MRPPIAPVAVQTARRAPTTIMRTLPPWFSSVRVRLSSRSWIASGGTTPPSLSSSFSTVSGPAVDAKTPSVTSRIAGMARNA
jgi:hypothetical protein